MVCRIIQPSEWLLEYFSVCTQDFQNSLGKCCFILAAVEPFLSSALVLLLLPALIWCENLYSKHLAPWFKCVWGEDCSEIFLLLINIESSFGSTKPSLVHQWSHLPWRYLKGRCISKQTHTTLAFPDDDITVHLFWTPTELLCRWNPFPFFSFLCNLILHLADIAYWR